MAEDTSKIPVTTDKAAPSELRPRRPLESLRQEIDRLFDDFGIGTWRSPFRSSFFDMDPFRRAKAAFSGMPAVDVTETEKGYKVVAELPGMDEKNIEVKIANGMLTIKGEKQEDKEEEKQDYYVRERSFGSFERTLPVPDGVDLDKVDASFKNGVLTVTLPKTAEAQKAEKKITVKASDLLSLNLPDAILNMTH
jgi:HSP20 family protein